MPILSKSSRPTEKVILPSSGAEVTLYKEMLAGDVLTLTEGSTAYQRGVEGLLKVIKAWDFVDDAEKPVPVDEASMSLLVVKDLSFLINKVSEYNELDALDPKKKPS